MTPEEDLRTLYPEHRPHPSNAGLLLAVPVALGLWVLIIWVGIHVWRML